MRIKRPDHKNALSMIEESERQMEFTLTLAVNDASSSTVVRNVYESFRMLGDALLISRGIEALDHIEQIDALTDLEVSTKRPISTIDNLRKLRHSINYYGYHPSVAEANDAVDIAKSCFRALLDAVKKEVKK